MIIGVAHVSRVAASAVSAMVVVLSFTACAGTPPVAAPATTEGPPSSSAALANPATTITAKSFDFGPPITVSPGATVTFVNTDGARHNVTADKNSAFASPTVTAATTTFTAPATPGTYPFHCTFHPTMRGTIIVK